MLEKLQIDNEKYVLYAPDSLNYITKPMIENLEKKIEKYYSLFKVSNFRKLQINLFDDLNKFREYIYSLRGEKGSLPEYATGTFDKGMINAFIENNIVIGSPKYINASYLASHELFHIMYQELIWGSDGNNRVVWFDEGMAKYFSGERDNLLDNEKFSKYVEYVINSTKVIPKNLSDLKHGKEFANENYNGYNLGYLAVRYLVETLSEEEFYNLMSDFDRIKELGKGIVQKSFDYYNKKQLN